MAEDFWTGYLRESAGLHSGRVQCEYCGSRWFVPKCWFHQPSQQCQKLLEKHREGCQAPPGEQKPASG